jgi:hypothetical protein
MPASGVGNTVLLLLVERSAMHRSLETQFTVPLLPLTISGEHTSTSPSRAIPDPRSLSPVSRLAKMSLSLKQHFVLSRRPCLHKSQHPSRLRHSNTDYSSPQSLTPDVGAPGQISNTPRPMTQIRLLGPPQTSIQKHCDSHSIRRVCRRPCTYITPFAGIRYTSRRGIHLTTLPLSSPPLPRQSRIAEAAHPLAAIPPPQPRHNARHTIAHMASKLSPIQKRATPGEARAAAGHSKMQRGRFYVCKLSYTHTPHTKLCNASS